MLQRKAETRSRVTATRGAALPLLMAAIPGPSLAQAADALYRCNDNSFTGRLFPMVLRLMALLLAWRCQAPKAAREAITVALQRRLAILQAAIVGVVWFAVFGPRSPASTVGWWSACLALLAAWILIAWRALYATTPTPTPERPAGVADFTPACCGVAVSVIVVGLMFLSHFLEQVDNPRLQGFFDAARRADLASLGPDFGARAHHAITSGLTVIAALVSAWVTAGLWWRCASHRHAMRITEYVFGLTVVAAGVLTALGLSEVSPGLNSALGNTLLCATWQRTHTPWMAPVTDANNVLGIFIPLMLGLGCCLLLEPATRPAPESAASAERDLMEIAANSRRLDHLLYLGALSLVIGTLQLSATQAWALAPLPGMNALKLKSDICKSLTPALAPAPTVQGFAVASIQPPQTPKQAAPPACAELALELPHAEFADAARQFARSTLLMFGMSFSLLLAALYAPAVLLLKAAAERAAVTAGPPVVDARPLSVAAWLQQLGIESDLVGKAGKVVATLSPLFAGVLANALSSLG
jgi:hypothetical protein